MNRKHFNYGCLLWLLLGLTARPALPAEAIKAFSLREADRMVLKGGALTEELRTLAGINRFAGLVFDRQNGDVILVGRHLQDQPAVSFDDLVVAMRSVVLSNQYPFVSIDPDESTATNMVQRVRFGGPGIDSSKLGQAFLDSDVILKRYSLGLLNEVPGLASYRTLYEQGVSNRLAAEGRQLASVTWRRGPEARQIIQGFTGKKAQDDGMVQSRFWYHAVEEKCFVTEADDVYVIHELVLGVKAQFIAPGESSSKPDKDEYAERFAALFSDRYPAAMAAFPALKQLKSIFDLLAVATGISHLGDARPKFEGLLFKHHPTHQDIGKTYPLIQMLGQFNEAPSGKTRLVLISGGVALRPLLETLQSGEFGALKDIVILSRTLERSLSWDLPLEHWKMPNDLDRTGAAVETTENPFASVGDRKIGCALTRQTFTFGESQGDPFRGFPGLPGIPIFVPAPMSLQNVKGVSMFMKIDKTTIRPAGNGKLRSLGQDALDAKPNKDSMSWPLPLNQAPNDSRSKKN